VGPRRDISRATLATHDAVGEFQRQRWRLAGDLKGEGTSLGEEGQEEQIFPPHQIEQVPEETDKWQRKSLALCSSLLPLKR
jgi:hypothetical protein